LQEGLIAETPFPINKGRDTSIENEVISLLPDSPGGYDEEHLYSLDFCYLLVNFSNY
jgi:hypothetical protein